jgi:hypothetical protein
MELALYLPAGIHSVFLLLCLWPAGALARATQPAGVQRAAVEPGAHGGLRCAPRCRCCGCCRLPCMNRCESTVWATVVALHGSWHEHVPSALHIAPHFCLPATGIGPACPPSRHAACPPACLPACRVRQRAVLYGPRNGGSHGAEVR